MKPAGSFIEGAGKIVVEATFQKTAQFLCRHAAMQQTCARIILQALYRFFAPLKKLRYFKVIVLEKVKLGMRGQLLKKLFVALVLVAVADVNVNE